MNQSFQTGAPGFEWRESSAGRILAVSALSGLADAVITGRQLRFREPTIDADYDRLARHFATASSAIVRVRQVHGKAVLVRRSGDQPSHPADADAVVVTTPDLVASVRIADCVPVLVVDRSRRVAAAIHAGWRGTVAGVTHETIDVIRKLGVEADGITAAIGPSIGPCCYQVSREVREAAVAAWPGASEWFAPDEAGKWRLDLWRANRDQLIAAGVPAAAIHVAGLCTADHLDDWYSHRREGAETGRMVAAIRLSALRA